MAEPRRSAPVIEDVGGARMLVVEARFYEDIADALWQGASRALEQAGATAVRVAVPGALEVPQAIALSMDSSTQDQSIDGAVALGCVIRGETFHFEIVAGESARALMDLSVVRKLPLGNGIITAENEAQAWTRARVNELNKGGAAAEAAVAVLRIKRRLSEEARDGEAC